MKNTTIDSATRISRRKSDIGERKVRRYRTVKSKSPKIEKDILRIIPLGGQNGIGEKNMIVVEYENDAIILDCGFELGIDLPGVNYAIPVVDYLHTIRHKIRGYIISHGHMDHIGGLIHIIPEFPAPIFGSQFTIGTVLAQFEKDIRDVVTVIPECHVINMDSHEKVRLGCFGIELVRMTHAIPEAASIVVDTPVGRIINTGDFRLDPEPLDSKPSDIARLKQLGDKGVLLLMSESTNTTKLGRTPTEHTLQDSFNGLISQTKGRMVVAVFSTNMNRVQVIINAAHRHGRKVALDGRSMMVVAELAVRLGNLKIPKDTLIPMREAINLPDNQIVVICTGGQGEPGAALSRMAIGEHQYVKLKKSDTVIVSSTPINGNEQSYQQIANDLASIGVTQFRHPTHELDGCGPLHVSGHAYRDEYTEMIRLTRPKYLMPIHGGPLHRNHHKNIGIKSGLDEKYIIMPDNGMVVEFGKDDMLTMVGRVTNGSLLVDQTGVIVPEVVIKDRLLLQDDGFVVVMANIDKMTGRLLSNPDIISRGHISVRDNTEVINGLRLEIRKLLATTARVKSRADIDSLKQTIKATTSSYLLDHTSQTPITVAVVNTVDKQR